MNRAVACAVAGVLLACGARGIGDALRVNLHLGPIEIVQTRALQASSTQRVISKIAIQGFCSSMSSGNPALPCRLVYVALPPNTDVASVRLLSGSPSTALLPGRYDIAPVPAIAASSGSVDYGSGKRIASGRNRLVYSSNQFYPREHVKLIQVGNLRTHKVAVLELWPYAYNPVTRRLRALKSSDVQLVYSADPTAKVPPADAVAARMSGVLENADQARSWYAQPSSGVSPPGYVIVTTNAIASASAALGDFVAWQRARGYAVRVATETDWGGGTGDVAAERIRGWLRANYLALNVEYVLLIGNPNPASGDVPMKMLWPRRWSTSYREAPSDYYYSDLTGNWDRDSDGYYGEEPDDFGIGGIDRIPEVYVGRIPYYGSIGGLDSVLRKTIAYESSSKGAWSRKFLLPMKPMDADTPSYQLGEQIVRDFVWSHGLSPDRVYDSAYSLSLPPEHFPCDYDTVQNEWANGAGFVFWMTHGSVNTAGSVFNSSRCAYLDDSKPSIVYMASCSNGRPEDSTSLGYCVLLRGGATTLSASRVSWYYLMETDFTASDSIGGFGYQYARFMLAGGESCGRAAMDARLANPMSIWANHLVYNLYGDPSLTYAQPQTAREVGTVGALADVPDGAMVRVSGAVLSRTGSGGVYYVQDATRCAGLRVTGDWIGASDPVLGDVVVATGILGTEGGLRTLTSGEIEPVGVSADVRALGVPARSLQSAKTFGLLVAVWGRVLSSSDSSFTITGKSPKSGVTILCDGGLSMPPVGTFVRVTGVSTPGGVVVSRVGDVQSVR